MSLSTELCNSISTYIHLYCKCKTQNFNASDINSFSIRLHSSYSQHNTNYKCITSTPMQWSRWLLWFFSLQQSHWFFKYLHIIQFIYFLISVDDILVLLTNPQLYEHTQAVYSTQWTSQHFLCLYIGNVLKCKQY